MSVTNTGRAAPGQPDPSAHSGVLTPRTLLPAELSLLGCHETSRQRSHAD